jgi:hypothetical protein
MVTDQEHPDFPNIFAREKELNVRSSSTKSASTLARMQLVAQAETLKYAVPMWLLMVSVDMLTQPCRVDRDTGSKPIVHSQRYAILQAVLEIRTDTSCAGNGTIAS